MKKNEKGGKTNKFLKYNQLSVKQKILMDPKRTEAILLLARGFAVKYAAKETGLTVGQVNYWAGQAHVKTTDFRNGKTSVAKKLREETRVFTMGYLQVALNKLKN